TVNQPPLVHVAQPSEQLSGDVECFVWLERTRLQPLGQSAPSQQLHDQVRASLDGAIIRNGDDVGMRNGGQGSGLTFETAGQLPTGNEPTLKYFQSRRASELHVRCNVDVSDASRA